MGWWWLCLFLLLVSCLWFVDSVWGFEWLDNLFDCFRFALRCELSLVNVGILGCFSCRFVFDLLFCLFCLGFCAYGLVFGWFVLFYLNFVMLFFCCGLCGWCLCVLLGGFGFSFWCLALLCRFELCWFEFVVWRLVVCWLVAFGVWMFVVWWVWTLSGLRELRWVSAWVI